MGTKRAGRLANTGMLATQKLLQKLIKCLKILFESVTFQAQIQILAEKWNKTMMVNSRSDNVSDPQKVKYRVKPKVFSEIAVWNSKQQNF